MGNWTRRSSHSPFVVWVFSNGVRIRKRRDEWTRRREREREREIERERERVQEIPISRNGEGKLLNEKDFRINRYKRITSDV